MANREILYNINADSSGFMRGISSMQSSLTNLSNMMKFQVGTAMIGMGTQFLNTSGNIVKGLAGMIKTGADYTSSVSQTEQIMGKLAKSIQDTITSGTAQARTFGVTEKQWKDNATQMAMFLKQSGLADDAVAGLTGQASQLAADMAAFKNVSPDEAAADLRSALMGNVNTMDKYGIAINVATAEQSEYAKSLGKSWKDMSIAEQRQAMLSAIMERSTLIQGQAKSEAGGMAAQLQMLSSDWDTLKGKVGAAMGEAFAPLIGTIGNIVQKLTDWIDKNPEVAKWIGIIAAVIAGLTAAIGIFLIIMGAMLIINSVATIGFGALAASVWAVTWPILAVIAVIAALVILAIVVYKNWDKIMAWFANIWEQFKGWASDAWNSLKDAVKAAVDWVTDKWNKFIGAIQRAWDTIKGIWNKLFGGGGNSTITVTDGTGGSIKNNAAGGIFTGTSLIGNNRFGEAGHEAVVPLTPKGVSAFLEGVGGTGNVNNFYFDKVDLTNTDSIRRLSQELNKLQKRDARGKGFGYGYNS